MKKNKLLWKLDLLSITVKGDDIAYETPGTSFQFDTDWVLPVNIYLFFSVFVCDNTTNRFCNV